MNELVELRSSWHWPKSDVNCWNYMNKYPDVPQLLAKYVNNKTTIVQAGGNCGFYPKQYSELFETVYTFEPDWLNFYCLTLNVISKNVVKFQACLGNSNELVDLSIKERNRGKNFVNGKGIYPVVRIDDLGLTSCSAIHLDIEGYEYFALQGAVNTIKKFKPVIVLEMWDQLDNRFLENANIKTTELLQSLGYIHVDTIYESDKVFIPQ